MGRKKIEIKKLESLQQRKTTFTKRSPGLVKKAYELSTLCVTDVVIIMYSPEKKLVTYCRPEMQIEDVLDKYEQAPPLEKDESRKENLKLVTKIQRELLTKEAKNRSEVEPVEPVQPAQPAQPVQPKELMPNNVLGIPVDLTASDLFGMSASRSHVDGEMFEISKSGLYFGEDMFEMFAPRSNFDDVDKRDS